MSCQTITPREDFQRKLEDMNPEAASAIKRMVEAEQLLKKKRGPLHPSTEEEIMQAAEVRQEAENCTMRHDREAGYRSGSVEQMPPASRFHEIVWHCLRRIPPVAVHVLL